MSKSLWQAMLLILKASSALAILSQGLCWQATLYPVAPRLEPLAAPRLELLAAPRLELLAAPRLELLTAPRLHLLAAPRLKPLQVKTFAVRCFDRRKV